METNKLLNISTIKRNTKNALRRIFKDKFYSLVNLLSLSIGLACSFLIMLYILSETGFDKCHENQDSIYRLTYHFPEEDETNLQPFIQPEDIMNVVPGIQHSSLIGPIKTSAFIENKQFEVNGKGVEIDIFEIFTIPFISGNHFDFNDNPNNIIISRELKAKLFGQQPAEGKNVLLEIEDKLIPFLVIGTMENFPVKSSIQADFFIQSKHLNYIQKIILAEHYIQIPTEQIEVISDRINSFLSDAIVDVGRKVKMIPQPLREIHFNSGHISNNRTPEGFMNKIILFTSIGLLILICSIINFVILASSRTLQKSKDIAVHKVFGANRGNVISLVMVESLLLAFLSFPFAILLSEMLLPFAKNLLQNDIDIQYLNNLPYLFGMLIITLCTGFLSGFYTAYISTKVTPIEGLVKRKYHKNKTVFQKGLLIFQLAIFTGLIMFTLVINSQLKYCTSFDMGFNKDKILNIQMNDEISFDQYLTFTNEVTKVSGVQKCAHGSEIPSTGGSFGITQHFKSPEKTVPFEYIYASEGYLEMCGVELVSGRFFEKKRNEKKNILINESSVRALGIDDPIGKEIGKEGLIIGVVKDFAIHSLHKEIPPLIIFNNTEDKISTTLVSFESGVNKTTIGKIKAVWDEMFPDIPFEAVSFGDIYNEMYDEDVKMRRAISLFAILAVIISSLGLFGMAHFTTREKTKEIGIRKVNGAKTSEIIGLIHKQSLAPYLIAILSCLPATFVLSLKWLDNFAYSTSIGFFEIITPALVTFIVFSLPVLLQSYIVSIVNPVESLKYE